MFDLYKFSKINTGFVCLFVGISLFFASCSSKIRPTKRPTNSDKTEVKQKPEDIPQAKQPQKKRFTTANVSLLIPFDLNRINLSTATKEDVEKHAMPIDFYQGFKLGIDSAATSGLNFKLNVFDTEDNESKMKGFFVNEGFKNSNLIVGPVFPKQLKAITDYSILHKALVVSPLAASNPVDFNNPNLVSIANNLDLHALKLACYIAENFDNKNTIVVIINTKKSEDENFTIPIRKFFKQDAKKQFVVQEYVSTYAFERNMIKDKKYAVIVASADRAFVLPTINKLFKLKNNTTARYDIQLFGHPSWSRQNYPIDQLENLNAIITTSYKIDYKSARVIRFIKNYRYRYGFEPGEYAFKGFDIGYYFGKLLSKYGEDYRDYITEEKYQGLHNNFSFMYNAKTGFINTDLILLRYHNFALETVR